MHIKKFVAPTVKDAMRDIKAEFGDSALLLSTKKAGPGYEVIAAVDYELESPVELDFSGASRREAAGRPEAAGSDPGGAGLHALEREIQELKELKDLYFSMIARADTPYSRIYAGLEAELTTAGIDKRLARKIIVNVLKSADGGTNVGEIKAQMRARLKEKISVADPAAAGGVVAFVGPAGVGKTTTVAKLAAIHSLKKKKKVALISTDTNRIAASEQLKLYGRIMGIPVDVARNPGELAMYLGAHSGKDLVLVDTAGFRPRDKSQMSELETIQSASPSVRFNLVLNSQSRDEVLYESIRSVKGLKVDSLTFTRLDEGETHGQILNSILLSKRPVAYLTAGQRVPEDIETATKDRLLNIFMPN